MASATVAKIEGIVLVTLQDDGTLAEAGMLLAQVGDQLAAAAAYGVLIDVAMLSMIDSFAVRMLANLVGTARLMGAQAVIAGMRPEVAIAMVELGADLPRVSAALNVDIGMARLRVMAGDRV